MLLMNLKEEENLTGVVSLTDTGFARYLFVTIYHGSKMEKKIQLFFLSEISIYLS